MDKPIGCLLRDLKQRGLLDSTLVLFASEFGRTPGTQGSDGRDHHIYGFSVWLAGGGVRGGEITKIRQNANGGRSQMPWTGMQKQIKARGGGGTGGVII